MNRRMLDSVVPSLYAVAILVAVFFTNGKVIAAVAAIGGVLVGMYYAGIRHNLRNDSPRRPE
jgi:membrane associated rhomboid family serine protease